jgi:glycyl-tRNA synthetase beta subunit
MNPIININGETAESHIEKRLIARKKVLEAMEAVGELRPHGRDYLGNVDRQNVDTHIYNKRFAMLVQLYNDLQTEAEFIQENNS